MRNNRRNEPSSAPTAPKQPRNDDPEGLGSFGKGILDARGVRDYWWDVFTGPNFPDSLPQLSIFVLWLLKI